MKPLIIILGYWELILAFLRFQGNPVKGSMSNDITTQYCPPSDTVAMGPAKTHCHCFAL